ncbi:MAG: DEAD/DEAH box helicase [Ruminococcaceae bacterium]|nr:DEAD/DEAH box helicase [Oscillospiraceae bacterium]
MPDVVHISVRELVAFVMRRGNADSHFNFARMREGTRLHRIVQEKAGQGYQPEVALETNIEYDGLIFHLTGRADGIIDLGNTAIIDEIKSTSRPLSSVDPDFYPEYMAQADCYSYMYALSRGFVAVTTRLTFIQTGSLDTESYDSRRSLEELRSRVESLLARYHRFAKLRSESRAALIDSAKKLKFPYHDYRMGQSDIILEAYRTIKKGRRLLVEAPTGIGKTLSVCYAAIKALGDGAGRRIFYLTPKSTVGEAPAAAFKKMREHGLSVRIITLTAKEKCCLCRDAVKDCSSILCAASDGHYDRISDALYELICHDTITPALTAEVAKKHRVCPYELSLDAAEFCDVIICDCNYLFDPRVYLRRFFDDGCDAADNIALIDEAHDLIDRAREMYSGGVALSDVSILGDIIPESDFILHSPLKHYIAAFGRIRRLCRENARLTDAGEFGSHLSHEPYDELVGAAEDFASAAMDWLKTNGSALDGLTLPIPEKRERLIADEVRDAAWNARTFVKAVERADKRYLHYAETAGDAVKVKLLCMDPSAQLTERMARVRAAVLFSATLTPMDYFSDLLCAKKAATLTLPSPFDRDQLFTAVMDKVSLRYADRENTIGEVVDVIDAAVSAKRGNYLVFLPSYAMLRKVARAYKSVAEGVKIFTQKPDMTMTDREAFLARFREDGAVVGFAVIGGVFSESIDLAGERLIGTIIVGTGLARLNTETNIIADYFAETREMGFEYAYQYPAMNKILQAVGRVIRSETDRGICVLVDDRFAGREWARLFPDHMKGIRLIGNAMSLNKALREFWDD